MLQSTSSSDPGATAPGQPRYRSMTPNLLRPAARFLAIAAFGTALATSPSLQAEEEKELFFHDDFEEALAASEEEGKPLIAIFSATWCPPCQTMKRNVYPSEDVQPFHDQFVWAYLDADVQANHPLMQRFGVSGIPHIAFLKPDGETLGHFAGAAPPEGFARILTQVLEDVAEAGETSEDSEAAGS